MHIRTCIMGLATLVVSLSACEREEDEIAPPEIAEVEVEEPARVEATIQPGGTVTVEAEPAEIEIETAFPITTEDIGDVMLVSGTVVGTPGAGGFFVRTEGNRVVSIQSPQPVTVGQRVQVVGPLQAADLAVFEGWEREFLGDLEAEWDVLRLYFVRANTVTPLP